MKNINLKAGDQAYLVNPLERDVDKAVVLGVIEQSETGQLSINGHEINANGKFYLSDSLPSVFPATQSTYENLKGLFGKGITPPPDQINNPSPLDITRKILNSGLTSMVFVKSDFRSYGNARENVGFDVAIMSPFKENEVLVSSVDCQHVIPFDHNGNEITEDNVEDYLAFLKGEPAQKKNAIDKLQRLDVIMCIESQNDAISTGDYFTVFESQEYEGQWVAKCHGSFNFINIFQDKDNGIWMPDPNDPDYPDAKFKKVDP